MMSTSEASVVTSSVSEEGKPTDFPIGCHRLCGWYHWYFLAVAFQALSFSSCGPCDAASLIQECHQFLAALHQFSLSRLTCLCCDELHMRYPSSRHSSSVMPGTWSHSWGTSKTPSNENIPVTTTPAYLASRTCSRTPWWVLYQRDDYFWETE